MRWFGESWGAPVCTDNEHAATPVGKRCMRCEVVIVDGDAGLLIPHVAKGVAMTERPHHLQCFLDELGVLDMMRHQKPVDRRKLLCNDPDCLWDFEHTLAYCGRA